MKYFFSIIYILFISIILVYYGITILSLTFPLSMYGLIPMFYGLIMLMQLFYILLKKKLLLPLNFIKYINIAFLFLIVFSSLDYMIISGLELISILLTFLFLHLLFFSFKYLEQYIVQLETNP